MYQTQWVNMYIRNIKLQSSYLVQNCWKMKQLLPRYFSIKMCNIHMPTKWGIVSTANKLKCDEHQKYISLQFCCQPYRLTNTYTHCNLWTRNSFRSIWNRNRLNCIYVNEKPHQLNFNCSWNAFISDYARVNRKRTKWMIIGW